MSTLKVLNVGQGDSSILSIEKGCLYNEHDIYIDLGNGQYDVSQAGAPLHNKILILSHAHQDHIGGLLFFINSLGHKNGLKEIWMPLFFEEISLITDKILNLRGIQNVSYINGAFLSAKNTVSAFHLLHKLSKSTSIKMIGIYEGRRSCNHFDFFHPLLDPETILGLTEKEITEYINKLEKSNFAEIRQWFSEPYAQELINILERHRFRDGIEHLFFNNLEISNFSSLRTRFSYGLLLKLRESIVKFVEKPSDSSFIAIFNVLKKSSNDCSIVFKFIKNKLDVLFTGDISKKILTYLTIKHSLTATVLKIPHHGSKHNLNKKTLKLINPTYAIISHGNKKFGRQSDPHPNKEIIEMLESLNVSTLYTNDVIKNEKILIKKPSNINFGPHIEYFDKY
ncbi:MBL fold metallo-hydrolase [Fictibacillus terranigra]|uniref:MBL fold metallo-hydrolase n=1 Tax=Fictibacillus terranigra TaxID=3058424 RepID=A0ABT8EAI0_9BACL|nr:MBL fold metallo-hydrolase [Fictibacillus sp. CENA-BCM004]MDN4074921.1 MBL fold metallo-hydrolase [Fictibacillus sp. CENA-BCM004]